MWFPCPAKSNYLMSSVKTRGWVSPGASPELAEGAMSVPWRQEMLVRPETGLAYFSPFVLLVDATEVEN